MKHILSYVGYFALAFLTNIASLFFIGVTLSFFRVGLETPYIFVVVTLLCGILYSYLSIGNLYQEESNGKPKKGGKILFSFIFFLFYSVVCVTIFLTLFSFQSA